MNNQKENKIELAAHEKALVQGDLSRLTAEERYQYYSQLCESLGLNPLTKPFEYIELGKGNQRKLTIYATKNCTDQLRAIHSVSIGKLDRAIEDGVYCVRACASLPDGRTDESLGAVPLRIPQQRWDKRDERYYPVTNEKGEQVFTVLEGEDRANAMMKAETKAKRRVTLSMVGLSTLDESEVDSIAGAVRVPVEKAHAPAAKKEPSEKQPQAIEHKEPLAMDLGGVREAVQVGASDSLQEKNGKMVYTLKGTKPEATPQKPIIRGNPWMHVIQKGAMAGSPLSDFEPDTIRKALRNKRALAALSESDINHMQAALDAYDNETPPDPVEAEFVHLSLEEDDVTAGVNGGAQ